MNRLQSILIGSGMPITVLVLVPAAILRWMRTWDTRWPPGTFPAGVLLVGAGVPILLGGWIIARTIFLFWKAGGTPAPWDPPRHPVVRGPYRYVRNPMYLSMLLILLGEGLYTGSLLLALWTGCMWILFHGFVILYEEPELRRRLGRDVDRYMEKVPRWIPRRRPLTRESREEENEP